MDFYSQKLLRSLFTDIENKGGTEMTHLDFISVCVFYFLPALLRFDLLSSDIIKIVVANS